MCCEEADNLKNLIKFVINVFGFWIVYAYIYVFMYLGMISIHKWKQRSLALSTFQLSLLLLQLYQLIDNWKKIKKNKEIKKRKILLLILDLTKSLENS